MTRRDGSVRKALLCGALILLPALFHSSLPACDRKKRPVAKLDTQADYLNLGQLVPNIYDGGWGYPRSAEVCTYDAECYPWRSGDGRFLFFASINFAGPPRPGHHGNDNWDIYISEWDEAHQRWGEEKNAGSHINTRLSERRPSCTFNGETLYFDCNGDICQSTWDGSDWRPAVALPAPVNTDFEDEHPAISADGKRLYFTSKRPGGFGGSDIWVAKWDGSSWSSVANMGPPVNTINEESRPFESYDGKRFYFTNHGGTPRIEGSYGGSDIYVCLGTDSGWGPVQLVTAPINSDLVACSPYETPDGRELWIGSESWEGSRGDEDIWFAQKGVSPSPGPANGFGHWQNTGELDQALYVYDLKEGSQGALYAATACAEIGPRGKVFKSVNGGTSWTPCAELPGTMAVYSLIVQGDTVYAGTYPNGDIFKSMNGGNSWLPTARIPGARSVRGLVRLQNGDILVGTSPPDLSTRTSIYRSGDGGQSWRETARLPHLDPCKFIYQTSGGAIFAGGWGTNSGVIIQRSLDNGTSWEPLTVDPDLHCDWGADRLYETQEGMIYVTGRTPSLEPGVGGGFIYKSSDQGTTWDACTKIMRTDGVHSDRVYSIIEDRSGMIYAGIQPAADYVVYVSRDEGDSWFTLGGLEGTFECLCLLQSSGGTIYAGTTPNGDVFKYKPKKGSRPR